MSRRDKHVIVANLWPRFYITFSVKKPLFSILSLTFCLFNVDFRVDDQSMH